MPTVALINIICNLFLFNYLLMKRSFMEYSICKCNVKFNSNILLCSNSDNNCGSSIKEIFGL